MPEEHDTLPTLDQLAADPALATGLSATALAVITARLAAVQQGVATALALSANGNGNHNPGSTAQGEQDHLLRIKEAAEQLRRAPSWIYRRRGSLPFVKRLGPRSYVCSQAGLERWLAVRKA